MYPCKRDYKEYSKNTIKKKILHYLSMPFKLLLVGIIKLDGKIRGKNNSWMT